MRAVGTKRSLLVAVAVALLVVLFPAAQPASAAGRSFVDRQNDVTWYSYEDDEVYESIEWPEVDIAAVDLTTTVDKVQVSTRVVDLVRGWWAGYEVSFDVNNDGSDDFRLLVSPDGSWELRKVFGVDDDGTRFACGGVSVAADHQRDRITTVVPRSCLANTAGVAVSVFLYDIDGPACCQDWVFDSYPDALEFTARVPYDNTAPKLYDPDGPTGTIYRLYRAYFLREPDEKGYEYWLGVYRKGYPLDKISNDFARSAEFQKRYGTLTDAQFLTRVYQNVLGRQPDSSGYSYWMDQMRRGMPRGFVMIYFSDSKEFRKKTASGRPIGY